MPPHGVQSSMGNSGTNETPLGRYFCPHTRCSKQYVGNSGTNETPLGRYFCPHPVFKAVWGTLGPMKLPWVAIFAPSQPVAVCFLPRCSSKVLVPRRNAKYVLARRQVSTLTLSRTPACVPRRATAARGRPSRLSPSLCVPCYRARGTPRSVYTSRSRNT